jgi:dTDP-4-amino-4,6-dideoxygalactose transaminase
MTHVPFNRPPVVGNEHAYIQEAIDRGHLSADGPFSRRCSAWLEDRTGCARAVVTHSATAALEMAALLLDVEPGDEIVMPSFTFVTTASAFALRGAVPVFVDIRPDTLNLDESLLEAALTERTRAIVAVHYAGVACELDEIGALAAARGLAVVEDAAQGLMSTYRGRALGTFGQLAALSFHETKNVVAGEGGALLVNEGALGERALVVRDKGTDRVRFYRGEVDKYSWVDLGSSFGLSELNAAFLWAQLEQADELTADRMRIWRLYHDAFAELEERELARRPVVPPHVEHNAHMYYLLVRDLDERTALLESLDRRSNVNAVFHYVPLHSSTAGRRYGRAAGPMTVTNDVAERLVRLPLWAGLAESDAQRVVDGVYAALTSRVGS